MRNLKLILAYDGSGFHGWQVQPHKRTVQQVLERAIGEITGVESRVAGAGRTDTGVHAWGQAASFKTETRIPVSRLRPALQSQLPDDVAIRSVAEVPLDFHAGYSSLWKHYRYIIHNSELPRPHLRHYATRIHAPLDVAAMNEAAQSLIGTFDFRSFESHFPNKATSVRTVLHCRVSAAAGWALWQSPAASPEVHFSSQALKARPDFPPDAPEFVCLDIVADGFLYNMVRAITGTLLKIGTGDWQVAAAHEILQAQDRKLAGPTAPPQGLSLMHVEYERAFEGLVM